MLSNAARGLSPTKTLPSYDTAAFSLAGKVGMGDLDIAEDGNMLWFVNLFDQKLYSVDITAFSGGGANPVAVAHDPDPCAVARSLATCVEIAAAVGGVPV